MAGTGQGKVALSLSPESCSVGEGSVHPGAGEHLTCGPPSPSPVSRDFFLAGPACNEECLVSTYWGRLLPPLPARLERAPPARPAPRPCRL